MTTRSAPPATVLVVLGFCAPGAGWWLLRSYSVPPQDQSYVPVVREFLTAALAADSTKVAAATDNPEIVAWGLATARDRPQLLRALLNGLTESSVRRESEEALVLFTSKGFGNCAGVPLAVTLLGPPPTARILALSADCDPRE